MTETEPLFELADRPEPETIHLVLANENGRLDPAEDDDDEEPPAMTRIICVAAVCPVYRWRPGTHQVLVQLRPLALHRRRPRPCPVHRFPRWRPC